MILFGVSCLLCGLFIYSLFNFIGRYSFVEKLLGVFLLFCSNIILTLEMASLFKAISRPVILLLIQIFFLGLAFAFNRVTSIGYPKIEISVVRSTLQSLADAFKRNQWIVFFLILVAISYIFLVFIQFRFPQNTTDSLCNHLSRIGHWMQQGSLAPYESFNDIGETYPYNHSLLMMWPMVFLKNDALAGLVQFTSAILISLTIFAISTEFGFKRNKGFVNGLIFLTFPIVALQSITAQNDLVVTCFLIIAFYFMIRAVNQGHALLVCLSILGFSIALGTKQYALFALPGYVALFVYYLIKRKPRLKRILLVSISSTLICAPLFGSYAYNQNWITRGSIAGVNPFSGNENGMNEAQDSPAKFAMTAVRFTYQFLSCEALPLTVEKTCIALKADAFRPLLVNRKVNIEIDHFLADQNYRFTLMNRYILNEEGSWFGMIGAILLITAFISGIIFSVKDRNWAALIIVVTSLTFFLIFCTFLRGWGPYYGRYFIFSAALLMPFIPSVAGKMRKFSIILSLTTCLLCVFILDYAILNNDSRPLISKSLLVNGHEWGRGSVMKDWINPYGLASIVRNNNDVWSYGATTVSTWGARNYSTPAFIVNVFVPEDARLAVFDQAGYVPDYLYYGDSLSRKLFEYTDINFLNALSDDIDFILVSPGFETGEINDFNLIFEWQGWRLFKRVNNLMS